MRALKRTLFVVALTLALTVALTGTAVAKTVKLSGSERTRLATFLTAFTRSDVKDFSKSRGVSDAQLIEFSTRELFWVSQYTPMEGGITFAIDAEAADALAQKYFGRRPKNRSAHSTITFVDGTYICGPYDVPAPRARIVKVTTSRKGYWTVTYNKFGWDGSSATDSNLAQCVATLKVPKGKTPAYVLRGLQTTKVKVPDVRGSFFSDAERALRFYGFRVRSIGVYAGDGGKTTDGTVYKMSPKPGTLAPKRSRVKIWWGYEHS